MPPVVKVSFGDQEREQFYYAGSLPISLGMPVVVESDRGVLVGKVTAKVPYYPVHKLTKPLREIRRPATPADLERAEHLKARQKEARAAVEEAVRQHQVPMNLVDVRLSGDQSRCLVRFNAEGRVDFRNLVRELAHRLRMRIEMRQIGARDEASVTGAIGTCGRTLCCKSWLKEFQPISIRMAKEQSLSLNSSKISGACGRLKCCLSYEYTMYQDLRKGLPKVGGHVMTHEGAALVKQHLVLEESLMVQLEDGRFVRYGANEVAVRKADYPDQPAIPPISGGCGSGGGCGAKGGGCGSGGGGCGSGGG